MTKEMSKRALIEIEAFKVGAGHTIPHANYLINEYPDQLALSGDDLIGDPDAKIILMRAYIAFQKTGVKHTKIDETEILEHIKKQIDIIREIAPLVHAGFIK